MELSLEFLIENLALSKENYQKKSSGRKYRCLCLDTAPGILSDGSLIVTNSLPKEENCPKNTGFLFVNLTQPVPEHVSYEYVHINSPVDYHSFFNQVLAIFQSTKEKIENLYRLSVRNASLQTLIEEAGELFDIPLYLVDSSFKAIAIDRRKNMRELSATWKRLEDDGYMPLDLVANLIQSQELNTMENEPAAAVIHSDFFIPLLSTAISGTKDKYRGICLWLVCFAPSKKAIWRLQRPSVKLFFRLFFGMWNFRTSTAVSTGIL